MPSQCHYFPCCLFCTTLYDAPYKFKSCLSLSVLSKDFFYVSNFFCIYTILCLDDDIFIFFIEILITFKFSFGTFEVCKHANFVLQLYSRTLNLSLTTDWLLIHYYYCYYFANYNPKVTIVYM